VELPTEMKQELEAQALTMTPSAQHQRTALC
jgi:hypothetical protein